jgi:hypothetical protein
MLEQGLWNYATRTVAIDASEDVEPEFGYTFAIAKPDDYAGRFVSISGDSFFACPLQDYHEEGGLDGYIYCNVNPLYFRYISNGNEYGLNLADWPWTFARAVEYELAFRVAPHVTTMGEDSFSKLEGRKIRALRDARSKDALNQGNQYPPAGRLARSRGGMRGGAGSRRWND